MVSGCPKSALAGVSTWAYYRTDFPQRIRDIGPDLVFNIAEGLRGPARESIVPAWLDYLGIAYTGSDGLSLALSLLKPVFFRKRVVARQFGIPVLGSVSLIVSSGQAVVSRSKTVAWVMANLALIVLGGAVVLLTGPITKILQTITNGAF